MGQTLLQSGKTKSCGCLQASSIKENLQLCDGTSVTILESLKQHKNVKNTSGYTGVYQNKKADDGSHRSDLRGRCIIWDPMKK